MRSIVRRCVWAAVLAAMAGCSSSSSAPAAAPPPVLDPAIKGMEILGNGTDVFGLYAVEENVKGRILNVEALNAAGLLVYSPDVQEYRYEETAGQTISEYAGSRSASIGLSGSYMFFSAELKTTFTSDTYRRDDYSYASIIERHYKHALKVAPGVWGSGAMLRPYLSALARKAIDDTDAAHGHWSGAEILAAYGTHVMNGIYVGARLDYHLTIQILDESKRSSLSAFVKMKYGNDFASAEVTGDISQQTYDAMNAYNRVGPVINAKGGASQYAHPEDDAQYVLWKASLDSNPVFCGIVSGSLLPIWELAPTDARKAEIRAAFEAYAATQESAFIPLIQKITDVLVVNAGKGTSVSVPPGYALLASVTGDTVNGDLNHGIWNDTQIADRVYLAYKAQVTDAPLGIAEIHVASTDAATDAWFFGTTAGHAAVYPPGNPGCTANTAAAQSLNAGACKTAYLHEWYSGWCAFNFWDGACNAPATPLFLHSVVQRDETEVPIRCLVVGDASAVDANQPKDTRAAHIFWAPGDVNRDGKPLGIDDARWVIDHVRWLAVRNGGGALVNLNYGVQSFARYDWYDCGLGQGYDDAWAHALNDPADVQYIGVCYP